MIRPTEPAASKVAHLRSIYRAGLDPMHPRWVGLGVLRETVRQFVIRETGIVREIAMALIRAQRALDRSHRVRTVRGLWRYQVERETHLQVVRRLLDGVVK
jgi:hypothetical protein